ncbi:MAG TPA: serine/threonine-protein phosphatase, partial [Bacilli bacterium]|nr:serine/threonine-protein phosphatase [Bacilli bacterium]
THAKENKDCQGMGTTVVAAILTADFITFAHIGDSRGYLFNKSGFVQKTVDHSLVNELVRTGQITDEEAEHHPRKNVLLRALGTEECISVDCITINWEQGNYVLLCSDGLSNKISQVEMAELLSEEGQVGDKVTKLVQTANERGGEDNITVAVIYYSEDGSEDGCHI